MIFRGIGDAPITGVTSLDTGTLTISLSSIPTIYQTFTLIEAGSSIGTFDGMPEGTIFAAAGYYFQISYVGGSALDITVQHVPPP